MSEHPSLFQDIPRSGANAFPFRPRPRFQSVIWPGDMADHATLKAAVRRIKAAPLVAVANEGQSALLPCRAIVVDRKLGRIVREVN